MTAETRLGRCLNAGRCSVADNRGRIRVANDGEFVCPTCGRALVDVVPFGKKRAAEGVDKRPPPPPWLVPLTLFLVTLIFGGVAFDMFGPVKEDTSGQMEIEADGSRTQTLFRIASAPATPASLGPALVGGFLRHQGCDQVRQVTDSTGNVRLHCTANGAGIGVTITRPATANPISALGGAIGGKVDLALSARPLDTEFIGKLLEHGDQTTSANEGVIGLEAVAIIINPANPIKRLSPAQLTAILTGAVRDFSAAGGAAGPIHVLAPVEGTRTDDVLAALLLGNRPLVAGAARPGDSRRIAAAVAADPAAIGVIDLASLPGTHPVSIGPADGIALLPTPIAVASEDYPLTRRLYLYKPETGIKADAVNFVDFVASRDGERIVVAIGAVAMTPRRAGVSAPAGAPADYAAQVAGAERLSTTFRFRPGTIDPDTRALADIERVAERLVGEGIAARRLMLLGFADSPRSGTADDGSSGNLARQVATAFARRGLAVGTVKGFKAAMALADNATPAGRTRNRRVELWIAP